MLISPRELATRTDVVTIDIRPMPERLSELGFVPASMSVSMLDGALAETVRGLHERGEQVVLFCNSGNRSGRVMSELGEIAGRPVLDLDGGVLAWGAEQLPIASAVDAPLDASEAAVADIPSFRRTLLACFVAEAVCTDDDVSSDPLAGLMHCYQAAGVTWEERHPDRLFGVVDQASLLFRRLGGPLERIAFNMSRMYAMLTRLPRS